MSEFLEVTRDGHVATLWLNRPQKLNALHQELWDAIPQAMAELDDDPEVRVIMVAGRGRGLTAGIDLQAFGPLMASGESPIGGATSPVGKRRQTYKAILAMQQSMSCFADTDKPTIAVIHGHCLGAGMDLITACDMRVAAANSVFSVRETKIAMAADVGTLQRLPTDNQRRGCFGTDLYRTRLLGGPCDECRASQQRPSHLRRCLRGGFCDGV